MKPIDVLRKDRTDILKTHNNSEALKQFLDGLELGSKHNYNTSFNTPQYSETEKYGILYTTKGGSTLINSTLTKFDLKLDIKETSNSWHTKFKSKMIIDTDDSIISEYIGEQYLLEEHGEFDKILNGKSKKDLIIVTRNPIHKFLSGLWQELIIEFDRSYALIGFLSKNFSEQQINTKLDNLSENILKEIIYSFLKGLVNTGNPVGWSHASLYNETFYNFLEINTNLDKSKLRIIDIDSPEGDLIELLSNYNPDIKTATISDNFWTHRKIHNKIMACLISSFEKDFQIKKIISRELNRDFHYYTLLKNKYKKHFYNQIGG